MVFCTAISSKRSATPCTVGFIGDFLADFGQVILAVGILHMGQEFRAFAHQERAASKQIAGFAHSAG